MLRSKINCIVVQINLILVDYNAKEVNVDRDAN